MTLDLYASIYVRDIVAAAAWYGRFLGSEPSFVAGEAEMVWELAESRCLAIEENAEHAGHCVVTIFVDDFDSHMAGIAERGIEPFKRQTYGNGVRKALFHDPDGNEIGLGGAPVAA